MPAQTSVLILGAAGMFGNAAYRLFAGSGGFSVTGTVRQPGNALLPQQASSRIIGGIDAGDSDAIARLLDAVQPQIVINAIGIIKQVSADFSTEASIRINALLPHMLAAHCARAGARLVHISTDCVFSGSKGGYREDDFADASDMYGRTKLLGELDQPHTITLRTSMIGHELARHVSLLDWFLGQTGESVKGYRRAIFSGLTTCELARVIRDIVIPRADMHGVWHVAADAISKYDLLTLIAARYGKAIRIEPDNAVAIDRSLDGGRFRQRTGYLAPPWPALVAEMHRQRPSNFLSEEKRHGRAAP